jgi:Polyketide cyclase / dehydrase and lipid transport
VKQLHGDATATVGATTEECLSLLAAIDRYPGWYPDVVREAEVLATGRDGLPTRARVTLHVSRGPLQKNFKLLMEVCVAPPGKVTLARIPHDASDEETFEVTWDIEERGESRRVRLAVDASLAVPRFLPLGTIGDDIAAGFVSAVTRVLQPEL